MLLGPVGEGRGALAQQVRAWAAFLDRREPALPWWLSESGSERVRVARERLGEAGHEERRPPDWFVGLVEEGMKRVARGVPFVAWGPGPLLLPLKERRMGLWPERGALERARQRGEVKVWRRRGMPVPEWREHGERQKYWLLLWEGGEGYSLHGVSGKGIWALDGGVWERKVRYGRG